MVDLALLQSVSYIAGALGVCVAAVYYVMTLKTQQANVKETANNRRAMFSSNVMEYASSEEWSMRWIELMSMQWSDFEDFKKKYDSAAEPKLFAKRSSVFFRYDLLGSQLRSGVITIDDINTAVGWAIVLLWLKFKPVIEAYRGWEYPKKAYSDFEFLSNMLLKRLSESDPDLMTKAGLIIDNQQKTVSTIRVQ
jgi:hypothetical protein